MDVKVKVLEHQARFITCQSRFSALIGGIGSGKTTAGALKVLAEVSQLPPHLGMIVAPTYRMLSDATFRTFQQHAQPILADFKRSEMLQYLKNGSEVLLRSAENPERLRGPDLAWVWMDEASLCSDKAWHVLVGRLRYTLPGKGARAGRMWITTTPKGRNWLYDNYGRMSVFRARTKDNIFLDKDYVDSLYSIYTGDLARQELEGEFVAWEGLVYREFSRDAHVKPVENNEAWRVVIGLDFGFTNPTAAIVVAFDGDDKAYALDELYKRRLTPDDLVVAVRELADRYRPESIICDPSEPGQIEALRRAGLPASPSRVRSVIEGIRDIQSRLAGGRLIVSPQCANLIAEFETYVWNDRKDAPVKANDHALDALRYALSSVKRTGVIFLG